MTAADSPEGPQRKIIHVDMDAFYASVEQRDNPDLRGRPVAVGRKHGRGVVAAASYEARAFGVHSAMPSFKAAEKCPDLVFVEPHFDVYRAVSMQIREIFTEHTLLIEPLALDEAYLDVTQNIKGIPTATKIAREIRTSIRERVGLNASAGVSYNKFLAKLASDHGKPDGLYVITPEMGPSFVEGIAIEKFHGVGPVTAARMHACGIFNGLDLRGKSLRFLQEKFGKSGPYFHGIANGIDSRPVRTDRVRKSVGAENTFTHNLREPEDLRNELLDVIGKTWSRIERTGVNGRTVTLKLKYADFHQITRSRSSNDDIAGRDELEIVALDLLNGLLPMPLDVRLLGVTVSSLDNERADESKQLRLF